MMTHFAFSVLLDHSDWQTVVGAVMTGTHGGALSIPSLHEFCQSYKLIKADGEIVEVDREADKHLFSAMAPSIGVFGVVTEVTMLVVPMEYLEAKLFVIDFCDLSARFMGYMRENKYCRVVVYPSLNKATIWVANPVKKGEGVARGATEVCLLVGIIAILYFRICCYTEMSLILHCRALCASRWLATATSVTNTRKHGLKSPFGT